MNTDRTDDAGTESAPRQITELVSEGASWGYADAAGAMAGGYRTLAGAAEAAALHQLGRSEHRDLADAFFEHGTAGEALTRAVDANAAYHPQRWTWWYDAQRGEPTPASTPSR